MPQAAILESASAISPPARYGPAKAREASIRLRRFLPNVAKWSVDAGNGPVGFVELDFTAAEFDAALKRFGPALRFGFKPQHRSLASSALKAFLGFVAANLPYRVLLASCPADDDAGIELLAACGFLPTGCQTVRGGATPWTQMINIL